MDTVLIVVHLMVVIALVVVVLLQRSEGGALGMGGGGGFMTGRGQANALTKATGILGTMFFLTSLTLTVLANIHRAPRSVLDGATPTTTSAPAQPGAPAQAPAGGSLLDQLRGIDNGTPAPAPAAPAAPQPPQPPQQ
jgi:preprotein translocase subunit SecG